MSYYDTNKTPRTDRVQSPNQGSQANRSTSEQQYLNDSTTASAAQSPNTYGIWSLDRANQNLLGSPDRANLGFPQFSNPMQMRTPHQEGILPSSDVEVSGLTADTRLTGQTGLASAQAPWATVFMNNNTNNKGTPIRHRPRGSSSSAAPQLQQASSSSSAAQTLPQPPALKENSPTGSDSSNDTAVLEQNYIMSQQDEEIKRRRAIKLRADAEAAKADVEIAEAQKKTMEIQKTIIKREQRKKKAMVAEKEARDAEKEARDAEKATSDAQKALSDAEKALSDAEESSINGSPMEDIPVGSALNAEPLKEDALQFMTDDNDETTEEYNYPVELRSVEDHRNIEVEFPDIKNHITWDEHDRGSENEHKELYNLWSDPYNLDKNNYKIEGTNIFTSNNYNVKEAYYPQGPEMKPFFIDKNYYDDDKGKEMLNETLNLLFDSNIEQEEKELDDEEVDVTDNSIMSFLKDEISDINDNINVHDAFKDDDAFKDTFNFSVIDNEADPFEGKYDENLEIDILEYFNDDDKENTPKEDAINDKNTYIDDMTNFVEYEVVANINEKVRSSDRAKRQPNRFEPYTIDKCPNLNTHAKNAAKKAIKNVKNKIIKSVKKRKVGASSVTSKGNTVLSSSASTFMATLNKSKQTAEKAKNDGKVYNRKDAKFTNYKDIYSTTSSVMSNFISNNFKLSDLEDTKRNSKLQAMFYMMMGGEKKFVNFREDTARHVSNNSQMENVWGKKTTKYYQKSINGGKGYCYLCGGVITNDHYPEMEHKMSCTQFYTTIYNIVLYKDLLKEWQKFVDEKEGLSNIQKLYWHLNHVFNRSEAEKLYENTIFPNFREKYINGNIKIITGDLDRREKEINDFKQLLLINLSEFSWSHHTCNQIKTNYYLSQKKRADIEKFNAEMTKILNGETDPKKLKGAVLNSSKVSNELSDIKTALKDATNWNKRLNYVKEQVNYVYDKIGVYADNIGTTRKRLLIRSIRKMMIEVPVGNNAAVAEMKRLQKDYQIVNVELARRINDFINNLKIYFDGCFPRSNREKTKEDAQIYRNENENFPYLNDLQDIIDLLYYAFDNVSPIEGLRLMNNLFKSIHANFIRDVLNRCKGYNPFKLFSADCAKMKFSMNLLYRLRNSIFISEKSWEFKYDEFVFGKDYFNNHYNQITTMLSNEDYNDWIINEDQLVKAEVNGKRVLFSKNGGKGPVKDLFERVYNYYVRNVVNEEGIVAQKYNDDEIEILKKAVDIGPDTLLHILGFTRNLKNDATGRKRSRGEKSANKGGKRKRKTKKKRKRKTLKKRKRKGGKKVSIKKRKKNMRKTKYKK